MPRWDAEWHVFGIEEQGKWVAIGDLGARFRDGDRVSAHEAKARGLYRSSSIRDLMLRDDDLPRLPPSWEGFAPIGLGDVVLSKLLPVAAAWVSPSTARRPIDGNCLRLVGLPAGVGFWLACVIAHPVYQAMLARRAAGAVLPRVGLRDLQALRIPEPPPGVEALAAEWSQGVRRLSGSLNDLRELQETVDAWIEADAPSLPNPPAARFYLPSDLGETLLPMRTALRRFQGEVAARGWRPLRELLSQDVERLRGRRIEALRVLRLGDADTAFGFVLPDLVKLTHPTFRIYARPLAAGEVLLSTLGSFPKVVFNHSPQPATVWVADHWARFELRADAGALALLLRSRALAEQLALATTGMAQQFVPRVELAASHLPWPGDAQRREWHVGLARALQRHAEAQNKLAEVRSAVSSLVDRHLGGRS